MARAHQRVFALIMALLFLATAVAGGAAVIWQIKKDNEASTALQAAKNQPDAPTINCISSASAEQVKQEGTLQGTKLANFEPIETITELQCVDLKEGTGETVKHGATVTAHYTGAVAKDGVIFQSSHDMGNPIPFSLSGVIKGWTDGVPGMKVGGVRRLLIPAVLAYGANPPPGIPVNADLVFDIELVSVENL